MGVPLSAVPLLVGPLLLGALGIARAAHQLGARRVRPWPSPPDRSERATAPTSRPPTVSAQMFKIVEQPAEPRCWPDHLSVRLNKISSVTPKMTHLGFPSRWLCRRRGSRTNG